MKMGVALGVRQAAQQTAPSPDPRLSVESLSTPQELARLASDWRQIETADHLPMQGHAWMLAAAEALGANRLLQILVVRDGSGALRAVAPLAEDPNRPNSLEMLGTTELSEPTDVVATDEQAVATLSRKMARLSRPLQLRRLDANSPLPAALRRSFRGRGLVAQRSDTGSPVIPLHDGWIEPETQLSSRRCADLRRARRRIESMGTVSVEFHAPTPAQLPALLQEAMAVEARSWKGRNGTALLHDQQLAAFYRRYAELMAEQGKLRIAFLRVDGCPAATQIAVETAQRLWFLKVGYDEKFKRGSPGNLITAESIRYAAKRGLAAFEFLGEPAPWTKVWTEEERECVALVGYLARLSTLPVLAATIREQLAQRRRAKVGPPP